LLFILYKSTSCENHLSPKQPELSPKQQDFLINSVNIEASKSHLSAKQPGKFATCQPNNPENSRPVSQTTRKIRDLSAKQPDNFSPVS
jgi:hypothetical protein